MTRNLFLLLGGVVAALGSGPALAGDFGIRFSHDSGRRYADCCPSRVVCYDRAPVCRDLAGLCCDPAAVVCYRECAPVLVYPHCTPEVVVYRHDLPRTYYAPRHYRHHRTVRRTVHHRTVQRKVHHRTVQRKVHRRLRRWYAPSCSTSRYYSRSYVRPHRPRGLDVGFRYRGKHGRSIGASFRYRR